MLECLAVCLRSAEVPQCASYLSLWLMQALDPAWELVRAGQLQQPQQQADGPGLGMCMCMQLLEWPGTGLRLASGHEGGSLVVWDCGTASSCASLHLFKEPAMALAASASGPGVSLPVPALQMLCVTYKIAQIAPCRPLGTRAARWSCEFAARQAAAPDLHLFTEPVMALAASASGPGEACQFQPCRWYV